MKKLVPLAIAFVLVIVIRLFAASPFSLSLEHPYSMAIFGRHVANNLFSYAAWMAQCIDPFLYAKGTTVKFFVNDLLLLFIVAAGMAARAGWKDGARTLCFFLAWLIAGLLPALFLANHTYRYYAIYSLPAFAAIVAFALRVLLDALGTPRGRVRACIIALAALAALLSALRAHTMLREGLGQQTLADGTNRIVKRAATVIVVRKGLLKQLPSPPAGATILLGDCDLAAFDWESGPRCWYGDYSIRVYALEDFAVDGEGPYVHSPIEDGKGGDIRKKRREIRIDGNSIYAFRLVDASLVPVPIAGIMKSARQ